MGRTREETSFDHYYACVAGLESFPRFNTRKNHRNHCVTCDCISRQASSGFHFLSLTRKGDCCLNFSGFRGANSWQDKELGGGNSNIFYFHPYPSGNDPI